MSRIIYLTYDGLTDPLGRSQICPYIRELATLGHEITVISFEKKQFFNKGESDNGESGSTFLGAGTTWIRLRYHKRLRGLSTMFDVAHAAVRAAPFLRSTDVVHVRSYVLAPVALAAQVIAGTRFLFDIRGFWLQERIDVGFVKAKTVIATALSVMERWLFRRADWIVTLTNASLPEVQRLSERTDTHRVSVIPTAVDTRRFRSDNNFKVKSSSCTRVYGYVGSFGTWYDSARLLKFAKCVISHGDEFRLAVNNREDPDVELFLEAGVTVCSLVHDNVASFLNECDVSVFFIHPTPSKSASCPTKLAESLAMGLPVITSTGIGDVDHIIRRNSVGIVLEYGAKLNCMGVRQQLDELTSDPNLPSRCRETAERLFSLDQAVAEYNRIYVRLAGE